MLSALAAAVVGVLVAAVAVSGGGAAQVGGVATGPALTTQIGPASAQGVSQLLHRISLAAADGSHPAVKPGQYLYIESQRADTFLKSADDETIVASHGLHRRQVWESRDGTEGWLIDPAVNDSPEGETLSLPGEQGNTPKADLHSPSYDYLSKLTTDPDGLLARIYRETKGQGNSPYQEAFTTIWDLLGESYPPGAAQGRSEDDPRCRRGAGRGGRGGPARGGGGSPR